MAALNSSEALRPVPGFVGSFENVHCSRQSGAGGGVLHQPDHGFQSVKQKPLTGAADMREKAAFDRVVFRAVAGIVSHADLDSDVVHQALQILFEKVLVGRVAAAAVAQPQDRRGFRVRLPAELIPVPAEAVAGELRRVVAQAQVARHHQAEQRVRAVRVAPGRVPDVDGTLQAEAAGGRRGAFAPSTRWSNVGAT